MSDVTNRSGGTDFNADDVDIGGDVTGRDKVTQQTTHNYYGAMPAQPRRAELPHQPYFFGREDELKIIAEALDSESNGWGVLIDGPGGIGKTALAIRAGHVASDKIYPTKIFLSAKVRELTPQGEQKLEDFMLPNFMALITELARELGDEGIERIDPAERAREVRRFLENSHALIIIDNLETFDEKERERLFQFLKRLPRSCKVIVTSRRRTDVAAEIIRLDRLQKESALKLIAKLAERNKLLARTSDQERLDLYEVTKGNPLLIEWIAGQLGRRASNCRSIADACQYLESVPKNNDPLEYIFGDLLDTFTEHETAVLAALTHFTQPATDEWIARVAGIEERKAQTALEDLAGRALLIADVQTHSFILPPLVGTYLRRKRPEIVVQTGDRLTDRIFALVVESGRDNYQNFPTLEEEWTAIEAALPLFLQGDNARLQRVVFALGSFLVWSGRWDERLNLNRQAAEQAVAAGDLTNAGWDAYNIGLVYNLRCQESDVLACARRTDTYWSTGATFKQQAYALKLHGWYHRLMENYPDAIATMVESLRLLRVAQPESRDVVIGLDSLAETERRAGDYAAAERDYNEALRIATKNGFHDLVALCMSDLIEVVLDRQDWHDAERLAREALPLCESVGKQDTIANCTRDLAKALARQGRQAEGLLYARRAVDLFTRWRLPGLEKDALAVLKECGG